MDDLKFIAVIVGILGALVGVYFRETLRKANKKLRAAIYLESNLRYWIKVGLYDEHFEKFLIAGYSLSEKKRKALETGNLEEISKFNEEFKDRLSSIRKDSERLKEEFKKIIEDAKLFKKEELNEIIKELDRRIDSLERGDGLISTSDLVYLDWFKLPDILEVKSEIINILVSLKLLITHISVRESVDEALIINQVLSSIDSGLKASMHIVPLLKYAEIIRKKGVWGNII